MNGKTKLERSARRPCASCAGHTCSTRSATAGRAKFRRGGKTVLTVYIREDRYDFLVISARRSARHSSGRARRSRRRSGTSRRQPDVSRREMDAYPGRRYGNARGGQAARPDQEKAEPQAVSEEQRSTQNAACDAICASTTRAARQRGIPGGAARAPDARVWH